MKAHNIFHCLPISKYANNYKILMIFNSLRTKDPGTTWLGIALRAFFFCDFNYVFVIWMEQTIDLITQHIKHISTLGLCPDSCKCARIGWSPINPVHILPSWAQANFELHNASAVAAGVAGSASPQGVCVRLRSFSAVKCSGSKSNRRGRRILAEVQKHKMPLTFGNRDNLRFSIWRSDWWLIWQEQWP